LQFINEIGIATEFRKVNEDECFLPGLLIENGKIIIDKDNLKYKGDLLHEAAHIAVVPAAERRSLHGYSIAKRNDAPAEEMMAIAWSYAACIHLDIDPSFVFHPDGYKEGAQNIIDNFRQGKYIGVPVLQWLGMTSTSVSESKVYPAMIKWLRD
jgi:hypothetical protein